MRLIGAFMPPWGRSLVMRGDQVVDDDGQIKRINAKGEVVRRPTVDDWQELVASEQVTDLSGVTNAIGTPQAYVPGARVWSIHHSLPLDRLASEPPIRLAGITIDQTRGWYLIVDNDEAKYRRARFAQELIQAASWTLAPAQWLKDRVAQLIGVEAAELAVALMDTPDPIVYATLANTYYKAGREVRARGISAMVRRSYGEPFLDAVTKYMIDEVKP